MLPLAFMKTKTVISHWSKEQIQRKSLSNAECNDIARVGKGLSVKLQW